MKKLEKSKVLSRMIRQDGPLLGFFIFCIVKNKIFFVKQNGFNGKN
jgi:hypothetical protein